MWNCRKNMRIQENFDDVYKVTTVDKYEDILPHFEVGGV